VLSQQPGQLLTLHPPPPDGEHWPPVHVPPEVVQSWQAAPEAPHCVSVTRVMHWLPWQHPRGHVDELQVEPASAGAWHAPLAQVPPFTVQFWQAEPWDPHCVSDGAATHAAPSQHPLHDCAPHAGPLSATPPSSPFPELVLVPPPVLPLLPLLPPLPLLLPLDASYVPDPLSNGPGGPRPDASPERTPASSPVSNAPTSEAPAAHAVAIGRTRTKGSTGTPNPVLRMSRSLPAARFQTTRAKSHFLV
jgi:hypothetical protein